MLRRVIATSCLVVLTSGAPALAGGFEYNENGARVLGRAGAFVARADDPMAIHYNPAGLVNLDGHQVLLTLNVNMMDLEYTRTGIDHLLKTDDNPGGIYDSATVSNSAGAFPAPAIAWGYGAERWGLGFGVYGPGAYGAREFPKDGPQRFMLTDEDVLLGYITASGAFNVSKIFSVGVSAQWVVMPTTKFGLTIDSAPSVDNGHSEKSPYLAQSELNLSDWSAFSAIFGAHFRPSPSFEVGVSSRPFRVDLDPEGEVTLDFPNTAINNLYKNKVFGLFEDDAETRDEGVRLNLSLAPWVRAGARYIHRGEGMREVFDVELDVVYERWSVLEDYVVTFDGKLKLGDPEDNPLREVAPLRLPKRYHDTVAVRLGSDWNAIPDFLTLRAGVHTETAAVPTPYTNLDFTNFTRFGAAAGVSVALGPVELTAAYQVVVQPEREVSADEADLRMQRPLSDYPNPQGWDEATQGKYQGLVVNEGRYSSLYQTVSGSVRLSF